MGLSVIVVKKLLFCDYEGVCENLDVENHECGKLEIMCENVYIYSYKICLYIIMCLI